MNFDGGGGMGSPEKGSRSKLHRLKAVIVYESSEYQIAVDLFFILLTNFE